MSPVTRINIIMPCFNGAKHILEAIESVLAQTFSEWQLIVIDDGSTDDSSSVIQSVASNDPRIIYIYQSNSGVSHTRNHGVKVATADLLAFLDCDDRWHPAYLEVMINAFDRHPDAIGAVCETCKFGDDIPETLRPLPGSGDLISLQDILPAGGWAIDTGIQTNALILTKAVFNAVGGFDESLSHFEDNKFRLELLTHGDVVAVRRPLNFYRSHPDQVTRNYHRIAYGLRTVTRDFANAHPEIINTYGASRLHSEVHKLLLSLAHSACMQNNILSTFRIMFLIWLNPPFKLWTLRQTFCDWLPRMIRHKFIRQS